MLIVPLNLHTIWEFFKFIFLLETSPLDWFLIIYQTIFWPFAINSIFHPPMASSLWEKNEKTATRRCTKQGKTFTTGNFFFHLHQKIQLFLSSDTTIYINCLSFSNIKFIIQFFLDVEKCLPWPLLPSLSYSRNAPNKRHTIAI